MSGDFLLELAAHIEGFSDEQIKQVEDALPEFRELIGLIIKAQPLISKLMPLVTQATPLIQRATVLIEKCGPVIQTVIDVVDKREAAKNG